MNEEKVKINSEYIKLDSFLKWAGVTGSGSEAKVMVEDGDVAVNHQVEIRRGRKLYPGDVVCVADRTFVIEALSDKGFN